MSQNQTKYISIQSLLKDIFRVNKLKIFNVMLWSSKIMEIHT